MRRGVYEQPKAWHGHCRVGVVDAFELSVFEKYHFAATTFKENSVDT